LIVVVDGGTTVGGGKKSSVLASFRMIRGVLVSNEGASWVVAVRYTRKDEVR
jgi:hypothetical protein